MKRTTCLAICALAFAGLSSLSVHAQTDTTKLMVGKLTFQARDAEYLHTMLLNYESLEPLKDSLVKKYRVATPPSNQQVITIDSVEVGAVLTLVAALRQERLSIGTSGRFETMLRALNYGYITRRLDELDAAEQALVLFRRAEGRRRQLGIRQ